VSIQQEEVAPEGTTSTKEPHIGHESDTFDSTESERYLDVVFGDRTGYVAMAYGIHPYRDESGKYGHKEWWEKSYAWPSDRADLLADVADAVTSGHVDVYVCPCLRNTDHGRQSAAGSNNAAPPTVIVADCDRPLDPHKVAALGAAVVASGSEGHHHVYLLLARPIDVATRRTLAEALRIYLGADHKVADNDLFRLPGTVNLKATVPLDGAEPGPPTAVAMLGGWE
jgi:hypothetical protein